MKNLILSTLCFAIFCTRALAQDPPLMINGTTGKFFINHTVIAKENWYSVGRLFNISPREIAPFNGLTIEHPLDIGQVLKVPLNNSNFAQKDTKADGETLVPIYHVVQEKEWMFRLSSIYNDVSVVSLEKWNHIKRDEVKPGMTLIVGYLRVKTAQAALTTAVPERPVPVTGTVKQDLPAANKEVKNTEPTTPKQAAATTSTSPPSNAMVTTGAAVPADPNALPVRVNTYATDHSNGGFFNADYTSSGRSASGTAATFKSTSGWNDGKYYALMNNVPIGMIIKVTLNTGKTIYAKVLGQLPEMKESTGLLIRVSNAASADLGVGEGKFSVSVNY